MIHFNFLHNVQQNSSVKMSENVVWCFFDEIFADIIVYGEFFSSSCCFYKDL